MEPVLMTGFFLRVYDDCEFLALCLRAWREVSRRLDVEHGMMD